MQQLLERHRETQRNPLAWVVMNILGITACGAQPEATVRYHHANQTRSVQEASARAWEDVEWVFSSADPVREALKGDMLSDKRTQEHRYVLDVSYRNPEFGGGVSFAKGFDTISAIGTEHLASLKVRAYWTHRSGADSDQSPDTKVDECTCKSQGGWFTCTVKKDRGTGEEKIISLDIDKRDVPTADPYEFARVYRMKRKAAEEK